MASILHSVSSRLWRLELAYHTKNITTKNLPSAECWPHKRQSINNKKTHLSNDLFEIERVPLRCSFLPLSICIQICCKMKDFEQCQTPIHAYLLGFRIHLKNTTCQNSALALPLPLFGAQEVALASARESASLHKTCAYCKFKKYKCLTEPLSCYCGQYLAARHRAHIKSPSFF